METAFVNAGVHTAREQVTLAQAQLDGAIAAGVAGAFNACALDVASRSLRAARASLDEMGSRIDAEAAAAPALRDCPACGESIRAAATRCGYCWKKL